MASTISVDKIKSTAGGADTFTLPTADGQAGQSLQTNGSLVLSFGDVDPNSGKGSNIASADPLVIAAGSNYFIVTGTTGFNDMTVAADTHFFLEFAGALIMTHVGGALDLPSGAAITTVAGDVGEFFATAANVVTCVNYTRADGSAVKIKDESIDSDHYVDGSIDNAHLADDAVDSDELAAGAVDLAHMSAESVDSDQYVDGSIDNVHIVEMAGNKLTGTVTAKGDGASAVGKLLVNCEDNSHGITIQSPVHSSAAAYTLTLPVDDGDADEVLKTNGSGVLDWVANSATAGVATIWIPANAMTPTDALGCEGVTSVATSANQPDMIVLDFLVAADSFAQFQIAFPKSWNEGTITYQVYWCSTAADTDNVNWTLQGVSVPDNSTIDVAYGAAIDVDDPNQGAAEEMLVSPVSAALTIASAAVDTVTFFRIGRDVSEGTAAEAARLLGVKLFFTTDAENDD